MQKSILMITSLVIILGYQNCAPFSAAVGQSLTSNSVSEIGGETDDALPNPAGDGDTDAPSSRSTAFLITSPLEIGSLSSSRSMTWDISVQVAEGTKLNSVSFTANIEKFSSPDLGSDIYYVSRPALSAGAVSIQIRSINIIVNGVRDTSATTFENVNAVVPANSTLRLSDATIFHELKSGKSLPSDTIAFEFALLWPNATPLPSEPVVVPTEPPGVKLYATACANCHGTLAASSKRGRSFSAIKASLTSVSQMSTIKLTDVEILQLVEALK